MNRIIFVAAIAVIVGTGLGFTIGKSGFINNSTSSADQTGTREPLYWVAPMDPNYRRDAPGLSPMGMELVPVYEESESQDGIRISAAVQQNLGLRTAAVVRGDLSREITTVGYTAWNGQSIRMLHTRADGWLERFNLVSVGDRVEAGQIIYELFAPALVSAQREYLNVRGNSALASAARDRLLALGFSRNQIEELDRNGVVSQRLVYRADEAAVITEIGVREGAYVMPQTLIASLASLDSIWVETEVFESDSGVVQVGQAAQIAFPAFPGETWQAEVAYIYPELEASTRTLRVRLVLDNRDHRIKSKMFANVRILAAPQSNVLFVPREAVIRSGRGDRVILALPDNRFRAQAVVAGFSSAGRTEIREGLEAGQMVVTSGQFLIDSEANGEQALARLEGAMNMDSPPTPSPMDGMPMEMGDMPTPGAEAQASRYQTSGRIVRIEDGGITLAHQPVEALGWPAMTMRFELAPEISTENLQMDDQVQFEFDQTESGMYRIRRLTETGR